MLAFAWPWHNAVEEGTERLATRFGSWSTETIANIGGSAVDSAMRLDTAGAPHVVFTKTGVSPAVVHYSRRTGTTWSEFRVDVGIDPAIALDSAGSPRIVYYDTSTNELKLAQ